MSSRVVVALGFVVTTAWWAGAQVPPQNPPPDQPAAARPDVPDTPAGKLLAAWLKALNSGDPKALREFHTTFGPKERVDGRTRQDANFFQQSRGLTLHKLETNDPHQIAALAQANLTEGWYRVSITAAKEAPHHLDGLSLRRAANPSPPRRGSLTEAQMLQHLEAFVDKLHKADVFSGAVQIAKDGKPLFQKAYGLANVAYQVPNRVDTKFNLGSMNKMFTAVAICQLAEQNKLAFTDTVGKHLPDFPNKAAAEKVTIHHLLTHTSGVGNYFNAKFQAASRDRFRKVSDYLPLFAEEPLAFEPGARFSYSNGGFMVLGAIVEKVSGQDYFDYVRKHIHQPAGMANTDAYELDRDTPNLAYGYTTGQDGTRRNNLYLHVIKGGPAGGGYSTVEDLTRFAMALRGHKLLGAKTTETLLSGKVEAFGPTTKYAYGFIADAVEGDRIVGHGGGFPGINSQLDIYLDSGYTVAVMSNLDPPAAQSVSNKLRELLPAIAPQGKP
jgi:CubicO group peptidase (beta-lactamase class C family)